MTTDSTTFDLGGETVTGEELWRADFADESQFKVELEGGSIAFHGEQLEIDTTANADGATVWCAKTFPSDLIIEFTATCHEEEDKDPTGRNFNLFFAAAGEDGDPETLAETERSGDYQEYHELPNYIFTWTKQWSRMRRDPGFDLESEFRVGAQPDHTYDIQILKRDGELAATIDGRLVHHWQDEGPHGKGWVGLRTWYTHLSYDDWTVYAI